MSNNNEGLFSVIAPTLWNALPLEIQLAESVPRFKSLLKTHFYILAFNSRKLVMYVLISLHCFIRFIVVVCFCHLKRCYINNVLLLLPLLLLLLLYKHTVL